MITLITFLIAIILITTVIRFPKVFVEPPEILSSVALFIALVSGIYWLLSAQFSLVTPATVEATQSSLLANYRAAVGAVASAVLLLTLENCKRLARAVLNFRQRRTLEINSKLDRIMEEHKRSRE
jgi:hypothetical protein